MESEGGARSLPKQIWHLGWISFFADICSEMAYPVLPLFIAAILGPSAPVALGFVEGIAESIVSFMKGASGVHSDITGRRVPYVQAGYGLSALGKPIIAFASALGWPVVLAGRALDRFGKGIRTTARDTLIVESAGKGRLGAAFGLQRGLDSAGAFTGVLATLALLYIFQGPNKVQIYRSIFLLAFIPGIVSVLFTLTLKDMPHSEEEADKRANGPKKKIDLKNMPEGYWKAVGITTVFALANSSDTFLILRANKVFGATYGATSAALLAIWGYALYNVVYTLISYPAGNLSDKVGRWKMLGVGWLIYAVVYFGFGVANAAMLWILFALYGLYIGATDGVGKALVGDFVPKERKGTAMGLFYMITGFATLAASGITGLLWQAYGERVAFGFGASMALVAVFLVFISSATFRRPKRRRVLTST